jgi:hypothetical protein
LLLCQCGSAHAHTKILLLLLVFLPSSRPLASRASAAALQVSPGSTMPVACRRGEGAVRGTPTAWCRGARELVGAGTTMLAGRCTTGACRVPRLCSPL